MKAVVAKLRSVARHEWRQFMGMVPPRLTKWAGWLLEWPYSLIRADQDQRSLFVISTPRSGSTVLYNLIAWNCSEPREVVGYGENSAGYKTARDVRRLRVRTMLYLRRRSLPRYVADKLVRSRYHVGLELLTDPRCYFIFVERNAEDTLAGLQDRLGMSPLAARRLHATRRTIMRNYRNEAVNQITVNYEDLLGDPQAVLARISEFLDLGNPLSDRYETPPNVGNFAFGDNGHKIRAGQVVATVG